MILFLYGSDTFRLSRKVEEIRNKFIKEVDPNQLNVCVLENKIEPVRLARELKTTPFLAKRRLVIIKNILSGKNRENLQVIEDYLKADSNDPEENIVVIAEETDEDKKSADKLFTRLAKTAYAQNFSNLPLPQLLGYLIAQAKEQGATLSQQSANELVARAGTDLWRLANELSKLVAYANGQPIDKGMIEKLVKPELEDNIFSLIDAVAEMNQAKALKLIEDFFEIGNEGLSLLAMLARQFKIIIQLKDLLHENPSLSDGQAAQRLGIHPFVAKKSIIQSRRFEINKLAGIYERLSLIDQQLKSSYAKPQVIFDLLVSTM